MYEEDKKDISSSDYYLFIHIYIYHTKLHCLAECPIRFTHYFGLWGYADTGTAFIGFMLK